MGTFAKMCLEILEQQTRDIVTFKIYPLKKNIPSLAHATYISLEVKNVTQIQYQRLQEV